MRAARCALLLLSARARGPTRAALPCARLLADCSAACQKRNWKHGHKAECASLKQRMQSQGAEAARTIGDASLPLQTRLKALEALDRSAPYAAAEVAGLYAAVRSLLREDAERVAARFGQQIVIGCAQWVSSVLWRGQRSSGRVNFSKADGGRVAAYIRSAPDAWLSYLDASKGQLEGWASPRVQRDASLSDATHRVCRDTLACLSPILAREEVARVLFCAAPGGAGAAAAQAAPAADAADSGAPGGEAWALAQTAPDVAAATAKKLREMLKVVYAREHADLNSLLEANLNQAIAILDCWAGRLGLDFGFAATMRFSAQQKAMHAMMAVPLAPLYLQYGMQPPAEATEPVLRNLPGQGGGRGGGRRP